MLPVQHGPDVVLYEIKANRAVKVTGEGEAAKSEADLLNRERAYGNIAELGFGVLSDFGLEPIGQILLDYFVDQLRRDKNPVPADAKPALPPRLLKKILTVCFDSNFLHQT